MSEEIITIGDAELEAKKFIDLAADLVEKYEVTKIVTAAQYASAGKIWKIIDKEIKAGNSHRLSITRKIEDFKNKITSIFANPIAIMTGLRDDINRKMVKWKTEQDQLAKEAEEKLRKERDDRQCELERQEAAQREKERIAREAQEKAEREAAAAQDAEERKRLAAEAVKAKAAADRAALEAEKRRQAALEAAAAPTSVAAAVPKVSGMTERTRWHFKIIDATKLPLQYTLTIPNESLLQDVATRLKEKASVPGVEFYPETKIGGSR